MDKTTKTLALLLFISLAGNFFLGGVMLAQKMAGPPARPDVLSMAGFTDKDRKVLQKSMDETRKKISEVRKDLEDIRKDVKAAMHADPFDQGALDEALRIETAKKAEILNIMRGAREDVMKRLSEKGRKALRKMAPPSSGYMVKMRRGHGADDDFPLVWEDWDDMPSQPGKGRRPPAP